MGRFGGDQSGLSYFLSRDRFLGRKPLHGRGLALLRKLACQLTLLPNLGSGRGLRLPNLGSGRSGLGLALRPLCRLSRRTLRLRRLRSAHHSAQLGETRLGDREL